MQHEDRVKHQIRYASLEEVSKKKKKYDKQFTTVTALENVQNYYNEKCTYVNTHWNLPYALKKFIQKRRLIFLLN